MARPALGENPSLRLHMAITDAEIASIDDWRFASRVPTRSEAVRRLCKAGLEAETLRAENQRLRAENAKLSELTETQAEKLSGCPFDREDYELDLDVPCPVCGGLGHPDSPNACLYPSKKSTRAARPALSEVQP